MERMNDKDILAPEMSGEEFDRIDENMEKHEFSDRYKERKAKELRTYRKSTLGGRTARYVEFAVAAAILVIATPCVVNAATDGELFHRLWGNLGKQNIESHEEIFVEGGKIDENGNPSEYSVTFPKVEYEEADPEKAEELIGDNVSTEPTTILMGDTTMTVVAVTRDKNGIVAEYTLEKAGGVDCLNYSELDNEAKGAWINETQNLNFAFEEGSGKIYVDLEKSTTEKLYCYEYMVDNRAGFGYGTGAPTITDHLTLWYRAYDRSISEVNSSLENDADADDSQYIVKEEYVEIPVVDEISTTGFVSEAGGSLEISPIAMNVNLSQGFEAVAQTDGEDVPFTLDEVYKMEITYKDGSTYLVMDETYPYDTGAVNNPAEEVASYAYICGSIDNHAIVLFNRIVDVENIEKITVNDVDYVVE